MPHEGYADLIMNNGPGFYSDMPISELAEHNTRAIEASVVSSTPPVVETTDGVTHKTRPTPMEPNRARGLEPLDPNSGIRPTEVRRPAYEGLEATSCQTELGEKTQMSPSGPCPTLLRSGWGHLYLSRSILTSSEAHRISIEERPAGHLSRSPERLGHLSGDGLRSSGMPHEGYVDPVTNDGPGFHSDMPVSELAERGTRAIEASVISSTPLVTETTDGVTHKTRPTPTEPNGARGLELPGPYLGT